MWECLVGDPDLLFLDEPTTGFDPSARRSAWNMINGPSDHSEDHLPHDALHGRAPAPLGSRRVMRDGQIVATGRPSELADPMGPRP